MSSPVVVANHIYLHLRNQRIVCIHLETGAETWRTTPFGKYQSMAVLNDKILVLDESGELLLISADPSEFDLIDRRRVAENDTWGHIAVSKNQIFIRRLDGLAAYSWK
jgi:outer membrane protein assembly factor BamB